MTGGVRVTTASVQVTTGGVQVKTGGVQVKTGGVQVTTGGIQVKTVVVYDIQRTSGNESRAGHNTCGEYLMNAPLYAIRGCSAGLRTKNLERNCLISLKLSKPQ